MIALTLQPGSLSWLLAHDIRLGWRGAGAMLGEASPRVLWACLVAGGVVLHAVAWLVVVWLLPVLRGADASLAPLVAVLTCIFTWMLAQTLFIVSRTLHQRGDLDLLLGSPLPPHHVFAAKAASIAAGSFGSIALLLLPIANVAALVDDVAWLGVYPTLVALALVATASGLALAIALSLALGPRRARLWTQMTGAVIAGAFVLGVQITAMLPARMRAGILDWVDAAWKLDGIGPLSPLRLPVDAVRGDAGSAALLFGLAIVLFAAATQLLAQSFAAISQAAAGSAAGSSVGRAAGSRRQFRGGLAQNLRRKEWRLLVRDPGMFAQLALQIIYTVPVAVVLLRNEALPPVFALAPTIVVIAAQVAASLAWITVSGEDAPELIATAPVAAAAVDRAKLVSVVLPVSTILALPLAALALVSGQAAMLTGLVAAAAGTSTALLNFWHPMAGNRRGMLRRHSQSKLIALVEHGLALLWAVAMVLLLLGSALAVVPVAIVVAVLACLGRGRRS